MKAKQSLLALLLLFFSALEVAAQDVYRCRGPGGVATFQSTPCADIDEIPLNTPERKLVASMRKLAATGQSIIKGLGADVDSIKQCERSMQGYHKQVNSLSSRVRAVARKHPNIQKGYQSLKDCGECRVSAEGYCRQANDYLDKAMTSLMQY